MCEVFEFLKRACVNIKSEEKFEIRISEEGFHIESFLGKIDDFKFLDELNASTIVELSNKYSEFGEKVAGLNMLEYSKLHALFIGDVKIMDWFYRYSPIEELSKGRVCGYDPSPKDNLFIKSLMNNEEIDFFIDAFEYFTSVMNRLLNEYNEDLEYDQLRDYVYAALDERILNSETKLDKKLGIVIPKWIKIYEKIQEQIKESNRGGIIEEGTLKIMNILNIYYYLEWLIGYSLNVRNIIVNFNKNTLLKFKKRITGYIGKKFLLDLEIAQPNVLSLR
ncbi:hypothetical protein Mgra_00009999 [Meloidogyne graminicola]|uniref:Uncharacterized protein n=1 Tax=Meloidogyne graminicola TaxID=189291 RepID=A0A8S9Z804_9BILA|nr:hypothetical protein Mgra_00009999 [Meloidogyne graminicola]